MQEKNAFQIKLMEKILRKFFFVPVLSSLEDIDSKLTSQQLKYFK